MQNVITVEGTGIALNIASKELPFGNTFTQHTKAIVRNFDGQDEVVTYVLCSKGSREPGRIYIVAYSLAGKLIACETQN